LLGNNIQYDWNHEEQRFLPLPVLRQHDENGRRLMQLWVGSNEWKMLVRREQSARFH
jgi:hypothetical protein